jgi:alkylated DNA repair dioxygenase AlkB
MPDLFNIAEVQGLTLNQDRGELLCYPDWLEEVEQQHYFSCLLEALAWKTESLMIAGRQVQSPRLVAWYGDPGVSYRYSGIRYEALPWHQDLLNLRKRLCEQFDARINSVLANLYRNGKDSVSWHADSEPELGRNPEIFSLSLGTSRFFDFRLYDRSQPKQRIELTPGSLLIMRGPFQHYWQHQVPKQLKISEARINLTFRYIHNARSAN